MAYDEELAERVRERLGGEPAVTERAMFGGLAFLVHGNMAVGVSGQSGLMVRCPPERTAELLAEPFARPMEMHGREARGWVRVQGEGDPGDLDDQTLDAWVAVGLDRARTLPPK